MTETRNVHRLCDVAVEPVTLNPDELRRYAEHGDAASLIAALGQITNDPSVLNRFGPYLSEPEMPVPGLLLPIRSVSPEVREEVLNELIDGLQSPPAGGYLQVYDAEDFRSAVNLITGSQIAPELVDVMKEQAGFVASVPVTPRETAPSSKYKVAVLGAGMSGVSAAIAVADAGFEYEIFEKSEDIGGTWRLNRYPGVAVDTPSIYYSFSFEVEPDWSKHFPLGAEYQRYLRKVVEKYGVKEHIRFNTEITAMRWDDDAQEWEITSVCEGEESVSRAKFVITATGFLTRPKFPNIAGQETFAGFSAHSTELHDGIDCSGKKVAVIGAGATAVQIVDALADVASEITVVQRQPHWILPPRFPGSSGTVSEAEKWLLRNVPFYARWQRAKAYWTFSDAMYPAVRVDPEWIKTHDLSISPENDQLLQVFLSHLEASFGDQPDLKDKLTPDFPPFGKRPVSDPGRYYSTLASETGHVLDAAEIDSIEPAGFRLADGTLHEVDAIIYATGFHLDWLSKIDIVGRNRVRLSDQWGNDPRTYLGGTAPNFPNFFVTSAPNTGNAHGGGHNFMTELANHYITECLQIVVNKDADSIEVKNETESRFYDRINYLLQGSVWNYRKKAHTYYTNSDGRVLLASPFSMADFWHMHRLPDADAFEIR